MPTTLGEVLAIEKEARHIGATGALSRLRVKVEQMRRLDFHLGVEVVAREDVLALIDEEMRDGQA